MYLITDDDRFRRRAGIREGLQLIGTEGAEPLLKIRPGERPPIDFAAGPSAAERMPWQVPNAVEDVEQDPTRMGSKSKLDAKKPYRWRLNGTDDLIFFTCARPGRTSAPASRYADVSDDVVEAWSLRIAGYAPITVLSMLGSKDNGKSEFSFYTFWGDDDPTAVGKRLSFGDVLAVVEPQITLVERPTTDGLTLPQDNVDDLCALVKEMVATDRPVVLMDSGGEQRTGAIADAVGVEDVSSQ